MATISNNDIARAIYLVSKDRSSGEMHQIHKKIIDFLSRKRLLSRSSAILASLRKMIHSENGVVSAVVSSAHKLHESEEKDLEHFLKKRYSAREVVFTKILDEKLLGGFRIESNNEVIDLTFKNKIGQLQAYLTRPKDVKDAL